MRKSIAGILLIGLSLLTLRKAFAAGEGRVFDLDISTVDHETVFDDETGEFLESIDLPGTIKVSDESEYVSGFWGGLDLSAYIESYFDEVIKPIVDYNSASYSGVGPAPEGSPYYQLNPVFDAYLAQGFMNVNRDELIALLAEHLKIEESFRSFIYDDATGKPWTVSKIGNPTIAYGHLVKSNEFDRFANGIDEPDGYALLLQDITTHLNPIIPHVKVPLTLKQWVMLSSHSFNSGPGAVRSSTYLKLINAGAPLAEIERNFKAYNKMTIKQPDGTFIKVVVKGLTNRRNREWAMFVESIAQNDPLIYLA